MGEQGDRIVITREVPEVEHPAELASVYDCYEDDLAQLLTDRALDNVIAVERTPTEVRWVIRIPLDGDEEQTEVKPEEEPGW